MSIQRASRRLRRFFRATEAASALEYAILVGVITVAVGAAVATFSGNIATAITGIGTKVTNTANTVDTGDVTPE